VFAAKCHIKRLACGMSVHAACWLLLGLAVLLGPGPARAATEYTLLDGLSQNSVLAVARDDDGFIWLGTEDGLNRFDGYEFSVFRPSGESVLTAGANYIRAIEPAGRYLFLGTNGGGLAVFDRVEQRFRLLGVADGLPAEHLNTLALVGSNTLYVGSRNGLSRLQWQGDPMQATFEATSLPFGDSRRHNDVWDLHVGPSGLWIATGDGVFRMDAQGRISPLEVEGSSQSFNTDALLEYPAGVLWVGSWNQGLFRVDLGSRSTRRFQLGQPDTPGLRSNRFLNLKTGPGGTVFAGTDRGLVWFDPACDCLKSLDHQRAARAAGRGFVLIALEVDEHGGVFAGFWGEGLVRFTPHDRVFHIERRRDDGATSLNHNRVRAVMEDRSGRLWVGSFGGGVQRVAPGSRRAGAAWQFESLPFAEGSPEHALLVWDLLEDRAGNIWVGTDDGVYWSRPEPITWQRERPANEEVPMQGVRALLEDSQGRIWVGSSGGLGVFDAPGAERRRVPIADGSGEPWYQRQDESIYSLFQDADDNIWVGSSGGLHIIDTKGQVLARYRPTHGLPGSVIWSIYRHTDGSLWLATSGGLAKVLQNGRGVQGLSFDNISRRVSLPHGGVLGVIGDRDGQLWLTSNRGLVRLDPTRLTYRVWRHHEGLASDEFNISAQAQGRDGWLYFGSIDGLTAFDPSALREQLERPRPTLARATMDGQPLQLVPREGMPPALRLEHDHAPAILDFTGLAFDVPGSAHYSYRLSDAGGFIDLGNRRSLILDRLPHGSHRLELAVDNRGLRESRVLMDIEVVPPLVATWPFRITVGLSVALTLALLYLWRVRALTRQRRELESQVNARTRELRAQKEALEATAEALVVANDKLKSLSLIDPLTGLPNRRALIEQTESILRDVREDERPALAIIDLDHFKRINDEYGHLAGDDVLRDFAGLLASHSGPDVVAGRWGGEEFLAVLRDAGPASARHWAGQLLDAVRARRVRHGTLSIPYRISIGIAPAMPGDSMNSLLARADGALYESKAEGRDQLVVAEPTS